MRLSNRYVYPAKKGRRPVKACGGYETNKCREAFRDEIGGTTLRHCWGLRRGVTTMPGVADFPSSST